jgi:hypothetical protein
MAESFLLTVPVAAEYRVLAPEVAARYAELAGGSADDGVKLSADLTGTLDAMVRDQPADAGIALAFSTRPDGVDIEIRCGSRTATVHRDVVSQS